MKLLISNNFTDVMYSTEQEDELISKACSFTFKRYRRLKHKKHPDIKQITLNYYRHGSFPTGWLGKVGQVLKENGITVKGRDIRDKVLYAESNLVNPHPPEPRYYQQEAVDNAVKYGRGIIHHSTGTGKTVVAANLIKELGGPKTLYIVPNLELLRQTRNDFKGFFSERQGIIGNSQWKPENITISTPNTLWSRRNKPECIEYLESIECLILDEAHHVNIAVFRGHVSNSWYQIPIFCKNAYYRFGFTATPGKIGSPERMMLEAVTGRIIHTYKPGQAIDDGFLTPPEILVYNIDIPNRISEWPLAYEINLIGNKDRNEKIKKIALDYAKKDKTVLIHVDRVEGHGEVLKSLIGEKHCRFIWGKTNSTERQEAKEDFKNRSLKILIGTVYKEGVDIPNLDVFINAGGGKKDRGTIQKMGRVLRKAKGKAVAIVIDFYDKDNGMLERHSKERVEVYKSDAKYKLKVLI